MKPMDFDLFVIGAGSGGIRAARIAAQLGARVAVAEHGPLGGTCVNVGCVPKKLFVHAAQFAQAFRHAAGYGWQLEQPHCDWPTLIKNKNAAIEHLNGIYRRLLSEAGVSLYESHATVTGANEVRLACGTLYHARHILVATGGQATRPDIPGAELGMVSDDAFYLPELPKKALIVGGGYIGVEFAGIFHGLGVETTLMYRGDMILRGFDDDSRRFLAEQLRHQGINLHLNEVVQAMESQNGRLRVQTGASQTELFDQVLFATGRRPNTAGLGLESLGVALTDNGAICVDENYTTAVASIHAIGDVIDRAMLTPVALAEGECLAHHLFGDGGQAPDYQQIPTCIFTQPEMASVGLTEQHAREQDMTVTIYRNDFRPLQYSLVRTPLRSQIKLVVNEANRRVIGIFMVGPNAGEIVQGLAVAMRAGATKQDFDRTLGIHPTSAEEFVSLREA